MEKLFAGALKFKQRDFEKYKHLFEGLGKNQSPHTLFIGCTDSRLVPNMITATKPGELFTIRNVANLIPPYRTADEYLSTTAAIEYAVEVLNIATIIICGHSNCGGCAALHKPPEEMAHIPNVRKWMEIANPVRQKVAEALTSDSPEEKEWLTEQINVVEQIRNLFTYPYIREKYNQGRLNILGWYYIIETGEIFNYNFITQEFEAVS